jgi:TrmH family RNA methyltransferase
LVEGSDLVGAGMAAGLRPQAVFVRLNSAAHEAVRREPAFAGLAVFPVTAAVAAHISSLETPADMLAVFPRVTPPPLAQLGGGGPAALRQPANPHALGESTGPAALRQPAELLVVYADHLADPGNLGTLIRAAAAFAAAALVTSPESADVWSPKVVRASMGAVFALPLYADAELAALIAALGQPHVYGLVAHGGRPLHAARLRRPAVLCVGAERAGLSLAVQAAVSEALTIELPASAAGWQASTAAAGAPAAAGPPAAADLPTVTAGSSPAGVESLNAGVAGAIALYEFARQRSQAAAAML